MQNNTRKLYDALDSEFNRQDAIKEAKRLQISFSAIDNILAKLMYYDVIERVSFGHYRKC